MTSLAFTPSSKPRRGFPSETRVGRGLRVVHGDKELSEKLGRKDLCPCGSGRRFQGLLHALRPLLRAPSGTTTSESKATAT
ncbi:MAG TPA: SEC-C metal-binding domain-containing protein [Thermoanaerobaculia bacterium]|nr:SEC-C metal-binding domain-containing protein [Thermoanaerobaculia bacterium]